MKLHFIFSGAFVLLLALVLGISLFFPTSVFFAKNIVLQGTAVIGAFISLILVAILLTTRFQATFLYRSYIVHALLFIIVISGISTILSASVWQSLFGLALEVETFIFLIAFCGWVVASFLFLRASILKKVFAGVVFLFVGILNFLLAIGLFAPVSIAPYLPEASTVGFINSLFILLCSVYVLHVHAMWQRIVVGSGILLGLFGLFIVGLSTLFILVASALAVLFVFSFFVFKNTATHSVIGILALFIFVSAFFLPLNPDRFPGGTAIRPGLDSTFVVVDGVLKEGPVSALFGSGPSTFSYAWNLYKPRAVNNTPFWNADFHSGMNFYSSVFVSSGLLGIFSWLILFGTLVWILIQNVRKTQSSHTSFLFGATSFILLWFAFDVPNSTTLMLTALIVGGVMQRELGVKKLTEHGVISKRILRVILGAGVIVVLLLGIYTTVQITRSAIIFENGAGQFVQDNNVNLAVSATRSAFLISDHAIYRRFFAELRRIELDTLLQEGITTEEDLVLAESLLADIVLTAQRAIERDPNNYLHHITLGNMYTQRAVVGRTSDVSEAINAYQRASELSPNNPIPPYLIARVLLFDGQLEEARVYVDQALTLKSDYGPAQALLVEGDEL